MYRIKTEEEFIKCYGDNWRNCLRYGWDSPGMDYLFGTPVFITNSEVGIIHGFWYDVSYLQYEKETPSENTKYLKLKKHKIVSNFGFAKDEKEEEILAHAIAHVVDKEGLPTSEIIGILKYTLRLLNSKIMWIK